MSNMKEYYYNESVARFYDPVNDNLEFLKPELQFYLDEIKNTKGKVLEAGVGTGRIFVPALNAGADMYGVDHSEQMLNILKIKIPSNLHYRIWQEDLRRFDSGRSFSLVIMPFRVFQHMLSVEDQLSTLERIYNVLEDGGRLIFDVFLPDLKRLIDPVENLPDFEGEYEPGKKFKRYLSVKPDYINQIQNVTFKFVWDENGNEESSDFDFPMRYYFRFELENLIARSKFKLEKIYGDFTRGELSNNSKEFVVVCSK